MELHDRSSSSNQGRRAHLWETSQERVADSDRVMVCLPSEMHVWRVELSSAAAATSNSYGHLSYSERERADRFLHADTRSRWIVARNALRQILACYADTPAETLRFSLSDYGKPQLIGTVAEIAFNLTHTRNRALVAVGSAAAVGIDAEMIRPIDWRELSESFFAPAEAAGIAALPPDQRLDGFFACWARKEAFAKAVGSGLSIGFDKFSVEVKPDAQPRLLTAPPGHDTARWYFEDLTERGVAAALVVDGLKPVVRRYDFA